MRIALSSARITIFIPRAEETRNKYIKLHELLTYDDLMGEQYLTKKLLPQEQKQE